MIFQKTAHRKKSNIRTYLDPKQETLDYQNPSIFKINNQPYLFFDGQEIFFIERPYTRYFNLKFQCYFRDQNFVKILKDVLTNYHIVTISTGGGVTSTIKGLFCSIFTLLIKNNFVIKSDIRAINKFFITSESRPIRPKRGRGSNAKQQKSYR